ncbi:hypothetical protein RU93_GL002196 [Enterococcus aquimarinus]|uniref:Uncharacterized protein n=1 Tax=Enterococcus aquimarinus TaxID=328396 RepID=A0A1L8QSG0_9ENTE|nr:hypothetical protein RU93_GL002196 [Enterococcus aquimarinus]
MISSHFFAAFEKKTLLNRKKKFFLRKNTPWQAVSDLFTF